MKRYIKSSTNSQTDNTIKNIQASYPAPKSKYSILVLTPEQESLDSKYWDINDALKALILCLREEVPEVRSIRPGKITTDEDGIFVELPILFYTDHISPELWGEIEFQASEQGLIALEI